MTSTALLSATVAENLGHARSQMALSLGWHIIIACFGVGMPGMILFAEWRSRRGDADLAALARTWAKAMGVLFAVGAVSGTVLSFEMGILWPGLMSRFGEIYGFPFTLEGFAFFLEAIFVGIYLFGWDRLSPRGHMLTAVPIVISGIAGASFVVAANAWMNTPAGFRIVDGQITDTHPWAAMANPSTLPQTVHMLIAAVMVTGFSIASVYAAGMLRGRRSRYHRLGLLIPLTAACGAAVLQLPSGHWMADVVAHHQPVKLAAMEGLSTTTTGAPLSLGGLYLNGELRGAIRIPHGLSLLIDFTPNSVVQGLDSVPVDRQPPVNIVHLSYNAMVGIGFALIGLMLWLAWSWWRRQELPPSVWFLRAAALAGPAAVFAMEAGWVTTEVGRQPWIVYQIELTRDAVSTADGLKYGFYLVALVYLVLTVSTVYVLRRMAGSHDLPAPQEPEPDEQHADSGMA